jgi:hypothetical protein
MRLCSITTWGLLDGALVANEIKHIRPTIPIVMLADNLELPDGALNSVDALVNKSDGAHFLWATVHFVLNVKPAEISEGKRHSQHHPLYDSFSGRPRGNIRAGTI